MQFRDEDVPEIIHAYTRAEAISDGVLIEVRADLLQEAGIKHRTAISCILWHDVIEPDELSKAAGQSVEGRLWDVLAVFRVFARQTDVPLLLFPVSFLFNGREHRDVEIKAVCGPGDDTTPCITMMHEWED
jgi:hypothetical protein